MIGKLIFADGTSFDGVSHGYDVSISGEVVFATGMMGYPESITDPSYKGQILILTYPLIGNYGIPDERLWESKKIMVSGLIVSNYIDTPSHILSKRTLKQWFIDEKVPMLEIKDTRFLTQKIRDHGTMLGKIIIKKDVEFYDPNLKNLVSLVSTKNISIDKGGSDKTIILIDCGAKRNIKKSLLDRGLTVITVPWDFDISDKEKIRDKLKDKDLKIDGIVISNGPGDPLLADKTIKVIKKVLAQNIPILGICLGHQLLALAAGGKTQKLKYGHRSQNQPCRLSGTKRCFITTQNHGFSVAKVPAGFQPWFINANDDSNEGIIHRKKPFMSVQFHPEATPGPHDTEWVFDYFIKRL